MYARLNRSGDDMINEQKIIAEGMYTIVMLCGDDVELCAHGDTVKEVFDKFQIAFEVKYGDIHH